MEGIESERKGKANDNGFSDSDDSSKIPSNDNNPYDDSDGGSSSDESTDVGMISGLTDQRGRYRIVNEREVEACQHQDISNLSTTLCIKWAEARACLVYCRWNMLEAIERWCTDEEEFRKELGLGEPNMDIDSSDDDEPIANAARYLACEKCSNTFEEFKDYSICNHKFCKSCWTDYIGDSTRKNVRSSLMLRCLQEDCLSVVSKNLVDLLAPEEEWNLYDQAYLQSYLAGNPKGKWCPTEDCKHAVIVHPGSTITKFTCYCCQTYCYRCLHEAHDPIPCTIVGVWMKEAWKQMPNWHVVMKRRCPRCARVLDLNGEHKRVYCPACNFHFCRRCLRSWLDNGYWIVDQYSHRCPEDIMPEIAEVEAIRARCKLSAEKHKYYEGQWKSLAKDQEMTIEKILELKATEQLDLIAHKQGLELEEISFITDAWLQVAECKRVLKWAGVYDYYFLAANENGKSLFNYLTYRANVVLDRLCSHLAVMKTFLRDEEPAETFGVFRERVCQKLSVTRNFFENMDLAFKEGCSDVETLRSMICSRKKIARRPAANDHEASSSRQDLVPDNERNDCWTCHHCMFHNDTTVYLCIMCYQQ